MISTSNILITYTLWHLEIQGSQELTKNLDVLCQEATILMYMLSQYEEEM